MYKEQISQHTRSTTAARRASRGIVWRSGRRRTKINSIRHCADSHTIARTGSESRICWCDEISDSVRYRSACTISVNSSEVLREGGICCVSIAVDLRVDSGRICYISLAGFAKLEGINTSLMVNIVGPLTKCC